MRKRLFATMIVAVVAAFAGYNLYQSQNTNTLSDLALANVEALAGGEWGGNDCFMDTDSWQCTPWSSGSHCYCWL